MGPQCLASQTATAGCQAHAAGARGAQDGVHAARLLARRFSGLAGLKEPDETSSNVMLQWGWQFVPADTDKPICSTSMLAMLKLAQIAVPPLRWAHLSLLIYLLSTPSCKNAVCRRGSCETAGPAARTTAAATQSGPRSQGAQLKCACGNEVAAPLPLAPAHTSPTPLRIAVATLHSD
jgi:hypothetical protein